MRRVFIVVPTFREPGKIKNLMASFQGLKRQNLRVLVVNGNPGDATSELLRQGAPRFQEVAGRFDLFWSGLVNVGFRAVLEQAAAGDWVGYMNADVTFRGDIFKPLLEAGEKLGKCQIAALTHAGDRVVSSGAAVRSWWLGLNRHPFAGKLVAEVAGQGLEPVDFLPGRCTLMPLEALQTGGLINEQALPHYGGDYEYTHRLKQLGYPAFLCPAALVECDVGNTGNSVYHKRISLRRRIAALWSIKSIYNPKFRSRFIWLTYPWYARPTALAAYACKSLAEVSLGGALLRKLFSRPGMGFSGSNA